MSILSVVQREAQPGRSEALIETIATEWQRSRAVAPGRRAVRLLQSLACPDRLLVLTEWDSLAAYRAPRPHNIATPADSLCVRPPTRRTFQVLWRYEHMGQRAQFVNVVLYRAPPARRIAMRHFLTDEKGETVRALPGLLVHLLYEDVDDPTHMLTLDGWAHQAAQVRFLLEQVPTFRARHQELGITAEPFTGRLRLDTGLEWN